MISDKNLQSTYTKEYIREIARHGAKEYIEKPLESKKKKYDLIKGVVEAGISLIFLYLLYRMMKLYF